jgi:hypothetical protein
VGDVYFVANKILVWGLAKMKATVTLPAGYEPGGTLDLSKNRLAAVGLGVGATAILLPITWLLLQLVAFTRPEAGTFQFEIRGFQGLLVLAGLVVLIAVMMVAHEAIHGLFFWAYTGERPVFGLRGLYAFAGAPRWYIPRGQYVIIGLAPVVVITILGLVLLLVTPSPAVLVVVGAVALNAAGSIGDLIVVVWLLARPPATLARDTGDAVTVYQSAAAGRGAHT